MIATPSRFFISNADRCLLHTGGAPVISHVFHSDSRPEEPGCNPFKQLPVVFVTRRRSFRKKRLRDFKSLISAVNHLQRSVSQLSRPNQWHR